MAKFLDARGNPHELPVDVSMYREAADAGKTFKQFLNEKCTGTDAKVGTGFDQILANEGIYLKPNPAAGIESTKVSDMLNGTTGMANGVAVSAGSITRDQVATSRILAPAAILSAVENKLVSDLEMNSNAFEKMVAITDTIPGDKFDRLVLDYSAVEGQRRRAIAQLAEPISILTIKASEVSRRIPTLSLGLEISDQAKNAATIDYLALTLARTFAVESNTVTNEYILNLLNGDPDMQVAALSTISGKVKHADVYDTSIAANGVLTQKAWMYWLITNGRRRRIDYVITDIAGALAIEQRTGQPTIASDNPNSPRINTIGVVTNPTWTTDLKIFITDDTNWPANTIMGLDSRYAIHRVRSLNAQYQAVEEFVMRRATQMRFDSGEIVYRLYDDAFEVLQLIDT